MLPTNEQNKPTDENPKFQTPNEQEKPDSKKPEFQIRQLCKETFDTELTYLQNLIDANAVIKGFINKVDKSSGDKKIDQLHGISQNLTGITSTIPYTLIKEDQPLKDLVKNICVLFNIQLDNTNKSVTYLATRQSEIDQYLRDNEEINKELSKGIKERSQGKGNAMGAYLIQPVQRFPRYKMLITDITKRVEEYNNSVVDESSKIPLKSLTELGVKIKESNSKLNEAVRAREKKLIDDAFGENHSELVKLFNRMGVKVNKEIDKNVGSRIAKALSGEPSIATVKGALKQCGSSSVASQVRTWLLFTKSIKNPGLQEALIGEGESGDVLPPMQVEDPTTAMKLYARLRGHTSVTADIMSRLNQAYEKNDKDKIKSYSTLLGLNETVTAKIIESAKRGLLAQEKHSPQFRVFEREKLKEESKKENSKTKVSLSDQKKNPPKKETEDYSIPSFKK